MESAAVFLVLIPVAADFAVLFHYGLQPHQAPANLLKVLAVHLAFLGTCASLAALTPNLRSFAAAAGIVLLCVVAANNLLGMPDVRNWWIPRDILLGVLLSTVTLGVTVYQYLARRRWRSLGALILGTLLVVASCRSPFWDKVLSFAAETENADLAGSGIELVSTTEASTIIHYHTLPMRNGNRTLLGSLDLLNLPPAEEAVLTRVSGRLDFPNGEQISHAAEVRLDYGDPISALLPGFEQRNRRAGRDLVEMLSVSDVQYKKLGEGDSWPMLSNPSVNRSEIR